ncbi:MAG: two-component system, chemotaxis family, protein-glutamate methylesterase/glutaminase [Acidobacteriota bacterium]|jgi:two-component system chemotaxis response regulator CheB|nr:two-component system, chemotaxis family, protein-glutamate methylesterase/glutaminase [Acidobacteriota bacterium]
MPIQVLVVDDSAVVRQMLTGIIGTAADMRVATASDPIIAMQKMKGTRPDVIVLDLEMPRMDGITFLRNIMASDPIPVVVCSGRATTAAVTALEEGAVEVIAKPLHGLAEFLTEQKTAILYSIRAAAAARPRLAVVPPAVRPRVEESRPRLALSTDRLIALGASTGGTEALRAVLSAMPADSPGIVVVQHMPAMFTAAFAKRLDECCAIRVREAEDGERVLPGVALVAPGNRHLSVHRSGNGYSVQLSDSPPVARHRPSVDVLFQSVAYAAKANATGVLLTGMGADGAEGLLAMRRAGALTIAQDEASSVVFGMPKEAIARGAAERVLPLSRIAPTLRSI